MVNKNVYKQQKVWYNTIMKKLIALSTIAVSLVSTQAHASADVIGALLLGGIVGSALNENSHHDHRPGGYYYQPRNAQPIYVPSPVYTPQPPVYYTPNPVYQLLPVYDESCRCEVMKPVRIR